MDPGGFFHAYRDKKFQDFRSFVQVNVVFFQSILVANLKNDTLTLIY